MILGSLVVSHKFYGNEKTVQAVDNSAKSTGSNNNNDKQDNDNSVDKESNTNVENIAYLEKYLSA